MAAAGRGDRRRRVKPHPAVVREPHLDPRVRVDVGHVPLAGGAVVGARREAGRDPRRHPAHPQQQRHRAGELLAVALLVREQEGRERVVGQRWVLVVGVAVRQVAQHVLDERVRASLTRRRGAARAAYAARVRRVGHQPADARSGAPARHPAAGASSSARGTDRRSPRVYCSCSESRLGDRERQIRGQRGPWVSAAGVAELGGRRVRRVARDLVAGARTRAPCRRPSGPGRAREHPARDIGSARLASPGAITSVVVMPVIVT